MIHNTLTGTTDTSFTSPSAVPLRIIRWFTTIVSFFVLGAELHRLWEFYAIRLPKNDYSTLLIVAFHIQSLTIISLIVIAFLIVVRTKSANAVYIAIFLAAYCALGEFNIPDNPWTYAILSLASAVTGIFFILSMQHFPVRLVRADFENIVRPRLLRWYLKALLHPRNLWIKFMGVLIIVIIIEYFVPSIRGALFNLLILLTGFGYLFTSYRLTTGVDHDRILWLFWGLTMIILTEATYSVLFWYSTPGEVAKLTIHLVYMLVLLFSFVMSFFFADAFNTGIFVRKTAVNAMLFLLVVFVYNTLEHYVLHWISHTLHLSNAVISSLASGFIVLCISPLHHRLTHFLTKKLKGHEAIDSHVSFAPQKSAMKNLREADKP